MPLASCHRPRPVMLEAGWRHPQQPAVTTALSDASVGCVVYLAPSSSTRHEVKCAAASRSRHQEPRPSTPQALPFGSEHVLLPPPDHLRQGSHLPVHLSTPSRGGRRRCPALRASIIPPCQHSSTKISVAIVRWSVIQNSDEQKKIDLV
jgi:hypothetical protein